MFSGIGRVVLWTAGGLVAYAITAVAGGFFGTVFLMVIWDFIAMIFRLPAGIVVILGFTLLYYCMENGVVDERPGMKGRGKRW